MGLAIFLLIVELLVADRKQDGLRSLIFLENKNVDMRIIIIFLVFILSATSAYSQKEKSEYGKAILNTKKETSLKPKKNIVRH